MVSWIIKILFSKIKFHYSNIFFVFVFFLTGLFKEFIIIFSLILIHEFGHLVGAFLCGWKIDKIDIYPYGGCVKFDDDINKSLYQEIIILLFGPFFQFIYYLIIFICFSNNLMLDRTFDIFNNYHYTLLFFNFLPIYPLDGGKLMNILNNYFFPYKKGNILTIILSLIFLVICFIFYRSFNFYLMGFMLIIDIIIYLKRQDYLYNKFLLERYLNKYKFRKRKVIRNKNNMYKERYHVICYDDKYITEKQYLNKRFGG